MKTPPNKNLITQDGFIASLHSGRIFRREFLRLAVVGLLAACSPKIQTEVPPADTPSTPTTSPTNEPTPTTSPTKEPTPTASPTKEPTSILDMSWSAIASLPDLRRNLKAAATADKIYAVGGYDAGGNFANSSYEYDPVTDTWQVTASLPTARSNMAFGAVGNKVYAIGGDPFEDMNESY